MGISPIQPRVQVFFVERNAIFELPVARGSSEVVEVVQVDKVIETRIASLRLSDSCEIRQRHRYSNYDKICDDNELEFNSIKISVFACTLRC